MLKKYLLPVVNRLVMPFGYPVAAGYHLAAGAAIFWAAAGSPRTVPAHQLLYWFLYSLIIGTAAVLVVMGVNRAAGYEPK